MKYTVSHEYDDMYSANVMKFIPEDDDDPGFVVILTEDGGTNALNLCALFAFGCYASTALPKIDESMIVDINDGMAEIAKMNISLKDASRLKTWVLMLRLVDRKVSLDEFIEQTRAEIIAEGLKPLEDYGRER